MRSGLGSLEVADRTAAETLRLSYADTEISIVRSPRDDVGDSGKDIILAKNALLRFRSCKAASGT